MENSGDLEIIVEEDNGWRDRMTLESLEAFFAPKSVAVIGASEREGSVGLLLMENLLDGSIGHIYPVNPNRSSVLGVKTYPQVEEIPHDVELAVIATPSYTVPSVLDGCGRKKVDAVIIISSGFSEVGGDGIGLENSLKKIRDTYDMRILGPNCLGIIRPSRNLNVSFAREKPSEGQIAFLSQSGAMGSSMLDWASEVNLGFSSFVSLGNMVDVCFADLIDFFGFDPKTRSICLYMETIKRPKKFISAARRFARRKPLIVLKGGSSSASGSAVSLHVGSTPTSDEIYDAVYNRVGITRVETLDDLFSCSKVLGHGNLPEDPNLAIITNAAGPAILALDTLQKRGGSPASFSQETTSSLNDVLPENTSKVNPLDVLGDASASRYEKCGRVVLDDPHIDGLLVIYCPQGEASAVDAAQAVTNLNKVTSKPILTAWLGGREARSGRYHLQEQGIPSFPTPEQAIRTYLYMNKHARNLEALYETPEDLEIVPSYPRIDLQQIFKKAGEAGRTSLSIGEINHLFGAYEVPLYLPVEVSSASDAVNRAEKIGYPIRLKIMSGEELLTVSEEKTRDVLSDNIGKDDKETIILKPFAAQEDIIFNFHIGSQEDPLFGTILAIRNFPKGSGQIARRTVGFPPLNQVLARRLLQQAGVDSYLTGYSLDSEGIFTMLQKVLVRISQLLVDFPIIHEIDIGPVFLKENKLEALEAEISIKVERGMNGMDQYSHLAIAPYPRAYVIKGELKDGRSVVIRPIKPEDESLESELFTSFSEQTWKDRFFCQSHPVTHKELIRYTNIDYRREMAMVGILGQEKSEQMIGIARLIADPSRDTGEFAVAVGDPWQDLGLGTQLTQHLIRWAEEKDFSNIYAFVQAENYRMRNFCNKIGFFEVGSSNDLVKLVLPL